MSKRENNISKAVMDKIHNDQIKMKSRLYFIISSSLIFVGLVSSVLISIFFLALIRFSLRSHGPMAQFHLSQLLSNFPWWAVLLAPISLFFGIYLLRKYDFSYKINSWFLVFGFILVIVAAAWLMDSLGLNQSLSHHKYMRMFYHNNSGVDIGTMMNHYPRLNNQMKFR